MVEKIYPHAKIPKGRFAWVETVIGGMLNGYAVMMIYPDRWWSPRCPGRHWEMHDIKSFTLLPNGFTLDWKLDGYSPDKTKIVKANDMSFRQVGQVVVYPNILLMKKPGGFVNIAKPSETFSKALTANVRLLPAGTSLSLALKGAE